MKRQIAVNIAGQRYVLRSDEDEGDVKEIAAFVDGRIRELARQTRATDTQTLAVLAALQIAEELFAHKRTHEELKRKVRDKSRSLLQALERGARI
jgi:cell division protein ZapA